MMQRCGFHSLVYSFEIVLGPWGLLSRLLLGKTHPWTSPHFITERRHISINTFTLFPSSVAPSNYTLLSPVVGELKVSIALQSSPSTTPRQTLEID